MAMRLGWGAVLAIAAMLFAGPLDAQPKQQGKSRNPAHDQLLKLAAPQRAAYLARAVGNWCIGTEAFLMGVVTSGSGEGNAYWSLRCADGATWALQVDPMAEVTAIDCADFKQVAPGKECFKKF